jgi:two-component system, chemotaxis family, protein-glutamate methylesterase/glutaminase
VESEKNGALLQYRCHIGHVLTAETMLAAQFDVLEAKLAATLVALKERAELCRQMSENARAQGQPTASLELARSEALERCQVIKGLLESGWAEAGRAYSWDRKGLFEAPRP